MPRTVVNKFNRGEVGREALERQDLEIIREACEQMENFLPMELGGMIYRPGTKHLGSAAYSANHLLVPLIYGDDDVAIAELTAGYQYTVWKSDARMTHPSTSMTITNGDFTSNLSGWNQVEQQGGAAKQSSDDGGSASLWSDGQGVGAIWQTFGGSGFAQEHSITIETAGADVYLEIGETAEVHSDDLVSEVLGSGIHNIRFTATAQPTITLSSNSRTPARVISVTVENGGNLDLDTGEASPTQPEKNLRWVQSADVAFMGSRAGEPYKIERRDNDSYSLVRYQPKSGPWGPINTSAVKLRLNTVFGSSAGEYHSLTANQSFFRNNMVGDLFLLKSDGQKVGFDTNNASAGDEIFSEWIKIEDSDATFRDIAYDITISGTATVHIQISTDLLAWDDLATSYTATGSGTITDSDSTTVYYRIVIKNGNWTSGRVQAELHHKFGSKDTVVRMVSRTNNKIAKVEVLQLGASTQKNYNWYRWLWTKGVRPNAPEIHEGRLWWSGKGKIFASTVDDFEDFSGEGGNTSRSFFRTIGFGPVERIQWLKFCARLVMGLFSDEVSVKASSNNETMKDSNVGLVSGSSMGCANVNPARLDDTLIYAQRSKTKLVQARFAGDDDNVNPVDMTMFHKDVCSAGIKRIVVSRHPDTRVFVLLDDGELRVATRDDAEDVWAWSQITTTNGTIEDVCVVPGETEDDIYWITERSGTRLIERMYHLADVQTNHFDSAVEYTSPGSTTLTGLGHLNGFDVGVWMDGDDIDSDFTVSGGQITGVTGADSATTVRVGLRYNGDYKSGKLYGQYEPLGSRKRVIDYHLSMQDVWHKGLSVGESFTALDALPLNEAGTAVDQDSVLATLETTPIEFNGNNEIDPRICIRATGPCKILAMTYRVEEDYEEQEE